MNTNLTILCGDALEQLKNVPAASVQCCMTSPPYFGLRDYKVNGQIGMEKSPELYVANLRNIFGGRDNPVGVWRALKDDGILWLNLGDSYAGSGKGRNGDGTHSINPNHKQSSNRGAIAGVIKVGQSQKNEAVTKFAGEDRTFGYKPKDLIGIPWRVAFALQAAGWYLRCDIIWSKPNPMPESVTDRPTKSHEYIFLLTKSPKYFYDHEAIKEPGVWDLDGTETAKRVDRASVEHKAMPTAMPTAMKNGIRPRRNHSAAPKPFGSTLQGGNHGRHFLGDNIPEADRRPDKQRGHSRQLAGFNARWDDMEKSEQCSGLRNKRSVWDVATHPYPEAHFATYPPALIKPCILSGSRPGDTILDPFGGSGTTGMVALELGRKALLIELNPDYVELIKQRTNITPGLPLAASTASRRRDAIAKPEVTVAKREVRA